MTYETNALGFDTYAGDDNPETPKVIDFNQSVAAGMSFAFIKARQGTYRDPLFQVHWQRAKAAELLRGAYDWLTPTSDPEEQANEFVIQMLGDFGELYPIVDYERQPPTWAQWPTKGRARDYLKRWLETVHKLTGKVPMIYTGPSYWREFGSTDGYWAQYPLWLAQYSSDHKTPLAKQDVPAPWKEWTFWQYGDKLDGLKIGLESKDGDYNFYKGTRAELLALTGAPAPVPPPIPPTTGTFPGATLTVDISPDGISQVTWTLKV